VPKKVEQSNDTIHRHKSNKIKIGMNEMRVDGSETCVR